MIDCILQLVLWHSLIIEMYRFADAVARTQHSSPASLEDRFSCQRK